MEDTNPDVLRIAREIVKAQPSSYNDIKNNLSDAVICYGDPTGCVRDDGCEVECLMLATWRHGVEVGAIAAIERTTELAAAEANLWAPDTCAGEEIRAFNHLRQSEKGSTDE